MKSVVKLHHRIRLNVEIKEDISMWLQFLDKFNGYCFFPERIWTSDEVLHLHTDSSGNPELGCGALFGHKWSQFRWPISWKEAEFIKKYVVFRIGPCCPRFVFVGR